MPFVIRDAVALRDGLQFRTGEHVHIVTRSGSDEEAFRVLEESLRDASLLRARHFRLTNDIIAPRVVRDVVTLITARDRDPELWAELEAVSTA